MTDDEERPQRGTVIGGRHGSPTVTVALPFSNITNVDAVLRDAVIDLASLVARLASEAGAGNMKEVSLLAEAAEELASRLVSPTG